MWLLLASVLPRYNIQNTRKSSGCSHSFSHADEASSGEGSETQAHTRSLNVTITNKQFLSTVFGRANHRRPKLELWVDRLVALVAEYYKTFDSDRYFPLQFFKTKENKIECSYTSLLCPSVVCWLLSAILALTIGVWVGWIIHYNNWEGRTLPSQTR